MKRRYSLVYRLGVLFGGVALILSAAGRSLAEAPSAANAAFSSYAAIVEARLARQHQAAASFLVPASPEVRRGVPEIESIATPAVPGALLHHWRGTAFVPGASAADFERLLRNFGAYPQIYAPQVLRAGVLRQDGDHLTAFMRVRQKHVIAVVMDTSYDVTLARLDPQHGYSMSRSTHIAEIDSPGSASEHALSPAQEHGFLWRLNTYWSYEERDGGLSIQIESITLTRSIPHGLAWVVQPFVESIPRESLEFTLRATANALHK
ncbi:hypothetical protein [Granulicella paludicola]|uniref:hypothetical protein n=1 Tax=Granulicella paludicola TaxID=474951 RepID=UPI0021DFB366|nr:hypothetical protein [Granulicella paludicola]